MLAGIDRAGSRRYASTVLALAALLLTALLSAATRQNFGPVPIGAPPRLDLDKLPLAFEPNAGQTDPSVRFVAHGPAGTLFFASSEVVLALRVKVGNSHLEVDRASVSTSRPSGPESTLALEGLARMQFVGANSDPRIECAQPLPGKVNYLVGGDPSKWQTDLPTYAKLTYADLYPGIDLAYTGRGMQLNGTYLVDAGADPAHVRWRFEGAESVILDEVGNLHIGTGSGLELVLHVPTGWQEVAGRRTASLRSVSIRYELAADGTVSFALGEYDRASPLALETVLAYAYAAPTVAAEVEGVAGVGPSGPYSPRAPAPAPAPVFSTGSSPETTRASRPSTSGPSNGVKVGYAINYITPPLRDIAPVPPALAGSAERESGPENRHVPSRKHRDRPDPVVQRAIHPFGSLLANMPNPLITWDGISSNPVYANGLPPDTNGEIGPSHYIQMVNSAFQIWSKTGVSLYGPASINTIFTPTIGLPGPCATRNDGDPVVLYDQLADRWLLSQFVSVAPYYQCIAVSRTSDPLGSWNAYAFPLPLPATLGDYPKLGVWPDGYYMSTADFTTVMTTTTYNGPRPYVFNRDQMLNGQMATFQQFPALGNARGLMLPSDLDGYTRPPVGAPNYFVEFDPALSNLVVYEFHVDWFDPASSSFSNVATLPVAPFTQLCPATSNCVRQQGTPVGLDGLGDRLIFRLAYRNFGTHESLVANHAVDAGNPAGRAGVRWYELRSPGPAASIYQQGTYAPLDGIHRWMGSVAMDRVGDMALGYSASGNALFPSIRYVGRLVTDTLGTMPQGETTLHAGGGSQTHVSNRWGDYSDMTVDPSDDCTFWYTNEYYSATSAGNWRTRIGSFKLPSCTGSVITYSTYLGGFYGDAGNSIAVDPDGNAYVAGYTNSADFPLLNAYQPYCADFLCTDAFVAKLDATGSTLLYSTFFGGSGSDYGQGIAVDPARDIFVAGFTNSPDLPTVGAYQSAYGGGGYYGDAFVMKLNPGGSTILYSTYLGGNQDDYAEGIALDGAGKTYVAGGTNSTNFPTANAFQPACAGSNCADAFVAALDTRLSMTNSLLYSTYLGGNNGDGANAIAVEGLGSAYLTGVTYSTNFPTAGAFQPSLQGFSDAFVARLHPSGSALIYSTYLGGSDVCGVGGQDAGSGIALDAAGSAYVTGNTLSRNFPVVGPYQPGYAGDTDTAISGVWGDVFVTKLSSSGLPVYSTYLGGTRDDAGTAIAVNASGNAYVTGFSFSSNFPLYNPLQSQGSTGFSPKTFVAKFNPPGSALVYSTYYGGTTRDEGSGIAVDQQGRAYITGNTGSSDFPVHNAYQPSLAGGTDAFIAKLADPSTTPVPGTPTITPTITPTCPPTSTPTMPPTVTPPATGVPTDTPTRTRTSTVTRTATHTPSPTNTPTATPSRTRTITPTNTPTSTRTNTPVPTPALVGHVTWEGRPPQPDPLQQLPITLTLKMGTSETHYPSQDTDASGFFTVSVAGLANGTYDWIAKGPSYIANSGVLTLTGVLVTNVEMGTMRAGDASGDGTVDILDFNILKGSFGLSQGQPGYDARADFNGDNVVDVIDFNLLKGNFGQSGGSPSRPGGP
jgi:hypothetical protein